MAGVTAEGFVTKTRADIQKDLEQRFRNRFGELFDVSPQSPDGQIIGIISDILEDSWLVAEAAYSSYVPSKAYGVGLDYITELNDVFRIVNKPTTVTLRMEGIEGTEVPEGSRVAPSEDNTLVFTTNASVVLQDETESTVTATCTVLGAISIIADTTWDILDPTTGWEGAFNDESSVIGIEYETDPQLRARRKLSVITSGSGTYESTYAALADLNINFVRIIENETGAPITLPSGVIIPANSYLTVVEGGAHDEIGRAIYDNNPGGIQAYGDNIVNITDRHGFPKQVGYSRPNNANIDIEVTFERLLGSSNDTKELIEEALAAHIESLNIGNPVIWSDLFIPATQAAPNVSIKSILIGKEGDDLSANDILLEDIDKARAGEIYATEV